MQWIAWAILVLFVSGIAAWVNRRRGAAALIGSGGCLVAGILGLSGALACLIERRSETVAAAWNVPLGSFAVGIDPLSALFLLPLFLVGGAVAWSALARRPGDYAGNHPHEHWLFLNATLGSAALALVARNAVLFLFAWEAMTVASFLLVENDQREKMERSGGWVYLTAGHVGAACLFSVFALMGAAEGVLDFASLRAAGGMATAVFLLACAGFGGKVGLAPLQAWYPESYPQAPAHIGAILSGVVGNLGIYGLLRILRLLMHETPPPLWWGYLLLFAGLASGVVGAARALASRDLSRLLAWSSVENYGLMIAGIGLGLLGLAMNLAAVASLGFSAAILHMLNHSASKGLLFLAAGTVYSRTGTRNLDAMGGLLRRLPLTGTLFLIGGLGAACLPPLNGFASEFLLMMAAYTGAAGNEPASVGAASMFAAVILLAVTSGLAVAAYVKAFGFIFLGNAKGPGAVSVAAERRALLLPHLLLALAAVGIAALSPWVLQLLAPAVNSLVAAGNIVAAPSAEGIPASYLSGAWLGGWLLAASLAAAALARLFLAGNKAKAAGPTWDCGYAAPDARMQYTASSFARPLADNFQAAVGLRDEAAPPRGFFPAEASFRCFIHGIERAWGFSQLFAVIGRLSARVRVLQSGQVQYYLLYMAVVLVILLLWKL